MTYNGSYGEIKDSSYELSNVDYGYSSSTLGESNGGAKSEDMVAFFGQIDDIKRMLGQYDDSIDRIKILHDKSLGEVGNEEQEFTERQIESMIQDTASMAANIKNRIRTLQAKIHGDSTRQTQVENVKRQFMTSIQRYQGMEASFRQRYKEVVARQYRIVKPDATEEEVQEVIDSNESQIFSQAMMSSNRRGQARTTLSEVQARHREIQKIEKTMQELAQLFHDMETLVAEQDETVRHIDERTTQVQVDIEQGVAATDRAIVSARAWRKKKWWCLAIIVIIIIIIAVVLGVELGGKN